MKKVMFLSTLAVIGTVSTADAFELNPYIAGRISYVNMGVNTEISLRNTNYVLGSAEAISDVLRDNLLGVRIAFGFAPFAEYNLRHEVEYAFNTKQKNSTDTQTYGENFIYDTSMQTQALLFNTYYDFNNSTKFTPYVGFGLGVSYLKAIVENTSKDYIGFSESRSGSAYDFAYALAAGVEYKLSENLACDLQVRYFDYGKATETVQTKDERYGLEFDAQSSGKVSGFDVALGLTYMF